VDFKPGPTKSLQGENLKVQYFFTPLLFLFPFSSFLLSDEPGCGEGPPRILFTALGGFLLGTYLFSEFPHLLSPFPRCLKEGFLFLGVPPTEEKLQVFSKTLSSVTRLDSPHELKKMGPQSSPKSQSPVPPFDRCYGGEIPH